MHLVRQVAGLFAIVHLALSPALAAEPGEAFAVDDDALLYRIDLATATADFVGPTGLIAMVQGLAIAAGGEIYATTSNGALVQLDADSGEAYFLGAFPVDAYVAAIDFVDDALVGVEAGTSGEPRVFSIDVRDATLTPIATLDRDDIQASGGFVSFDGPNVFASTYIDVELAYDGWGIYSLQVQGELILDLDHYAGDPGIEAPVLASVINVYSSETGVRAELGDGETVWLRAWGGGNFYLKEQAPAGNGFIDVIGGTDFAQQSYDSGATGVVASRMLIASTDAGADVLLALDPDTGRTFEIAELPVSVSGIAFDGTTTHGLGRAGEVYEIDRLTGAVTSVGNTGGQAWRALALREPREDTDGDGVVDAIDNCVAQDNPNQYDFDTDGIGNRCDPDLDQNCIVDDADLQLLQLDLYQSGWRVADLNTDEVVNFLDVGIMKQFTGGPPGPGAPHAICR